jgi:hypothetical protein
MALGGSARLGRPVCRGQLAETSRDHVGDWTLAEHLVVGTDHSGSLHTRLGEQEVLDFPRVDLLAARMITSSARPARKR